MTGSQATEQGDQSEGDPSETRSGFARDESLSVCCKNSVDGSFEAIRMDLKQSRLEPTIGESIHATN
jgi:hypothetical protein